MLRQGTDGCPAILPWRLTWGVDHVGHTVAGLDRVGHHAIAEFLSGSLATAASVGAKTVYGPLDLNVSPKPALSRGMVHRGPCGLIAAVRAPSPRRAIFPVTVM